MIVESEARKLWCPFGSKSGGSSGNRSIDGSPTTMCLGRTCMAWRWGPLIEAPEDENSLLGSEVGANETLKDKRFKPRKGFCGIAGKQK
jgi:hypothetical protein